MNREENKKILEEAERTEALECKAKPIEMWLESTSRCNFRCITCPRTHLPFFKGKDIDSKVFEIVREELFPFIENIAPAGIGEPMISEKFETIFDEVVKKNISIIIYTNGMFLTEQWIRKFLKYNIHLRLSLDSARESTLQKVRPGISLKKIIQSVELFNKLKNEEYSNSKAAININCVALKSNIEELSEVVDLAKRLDIPDVIISNFTKSLYMVSVYKESLKNHKDLANKNFFAAKKHAEELGVRLRINPYKTSEEQKKGAQGFFLKCYVPWSKVLVRANGDITPCCVSGQIMGNIKKDGFMQVWNGKKYRNLRKRIHSDFPPLDCRNCNLYKGINAGNAENRKSQENLKQKVLYFIAHKRRMLGYIYQYLADYL